MSSAQPCEPTSVDSGRSLQNSVSAWWWQSIGQGFSQLIHPGAHGSSSSPCSTPTSPIANQKNRDEDSKTIASGSDSSSIHFRQGLPAAPNVIGELRKEIKAKVFRSAHNMVATSIDKQDDLAEKYSDGLRNVRQLEEIGCLVFQGIDVTKMSDHFFLRTQRFDRFVYNFPHVGFWYHEDSYCQISSVFSLVLRPF